MRREVRFDEVSFRYDVDAPWPLHDLDLLVARGHPTAIVGEAGRDVLALETIASAVGLVDHDTYLFHDTLRANR